GTCFTLHRTGFGEPPCHHDAGALLPHPFTLTAGVSGESFAGGGLLSVPLSVGFRRLGFPQRPALRCPDFPRKRRSRDHPACEPNCIPDEPRLSARAMLMPHSGQQISPRRCSTNSPHTRHSRLAPRSSANTSCSSVRFKGATVTARGTPPRPCRGS